MIPEIAAEPGGLDIRLRQGQTAGPWRQDFVTLRSAAEPVVWSATATYLKDDVVLSNGLEWVALRDNTNVLPVAGADWASNEEIVNLTGFTIRIGIIAADSKGDPTGNTLLSFATDEPSDNGSTVTIVDGPNGHVEIKITDEDTAELPVWRLRETDAGAIDGRGLWDEELENPYGDVPIVIQGRVTVRPQVKK